MSTKRRRTPFSQRTTRAAHYCRRTTWLCIGSYLNIILRVEAQGSSTRPHVQSTHGTRRTLTSYSPRNAVGWPPAALAARAPCSSPNESESNTCTEWDTGGGVVVDTSPN